MPGFEIEDDELKKLFAEAEGAVMKAQHRPAAAPVTVVAPVAEIQPPPAAVPGPVAASPSVAPLAAPTPAPPPVTAVQPPVSQAPGPSAEPRRLAGGEQTGEGLVARAADGDTLQMPWAAMRGLTLGRVADRQWLAFACQGQLYYFSDDGVVYKGLLRSLQATSAMNWRGLVAELAAHVADASDPGVSVVTGEGGGVIPKYQDKPSFWSAVTARA